MGGSSSASLLSSEEDEDAPSPLPLPLRARTRANQHAACACGARDASRAPVVVGAGGSFAQLALQRRYLLVELVERARRHRQATAATAAHGAGRALPTRSAHVARRTRAAGRGGV
jgi:hypothetical protein